MMMPLGAIFETSCPAFELDLADEFSLDQRMQVSVYRSTRGTRICPVDPPVDFIGRRVEGTFRKALENRIPLGRAAESLPPEGAHRVRSLKSQLKSE
jgi:hypothetical protein